MKRWLRSSWVWGGLFVALIIFGVALTFRQRELSAMQISLDKLAAVSLSERWSNPEMLKIRQLGDRAIPPLRRVLREKDKPTTRFLLWVRGKWPGVVKFYPYIPDANKLSERRWTACQVLQTLGPAGKAAAPELVRIIASKDAREANGGSMALWAVGIDAKVCEQLDEVLEKGSSGFGRSQIVSALSAVKPPSERTVKALTAALSDPTPWVQRQAAQTLGELGVATPPIIRALKRLESTSTDDLTIITVCASLYELERDSQSITGRVFQVMEKQVQLPITLPMGGGHGGQGVNGTEQIFMKASALLPKMNLGNPEKAKALEILQSFCEKSGRIFIRMLLLQAMMDLGMTREKCIEVCDSGLQQEEIYYRLQAAQLLVSVSDRFQGQGIDPEPLIHDQDVGVRVYASWIHWKKNKRASDVVPILVEALDRNKHQSYYYAQILPEALKTLGEIGADARAADSAVAALARDPNPTIAKLATETLNKMRK
jgi:hypothetical protein